MATVIRDQKLRFGELDLTGTANSLSLEYSADAPEKTVLGDDTHKFSAGGLFSVACGAEGFWDAAFDEKLFAELSADGKLISYSASNNHGDTAYMFKALAGAYAPMNGGAVGELLKYSFAAAAQGKLLRGKIMAVTPAGVASGNAVALQLGAVPAGKKVYAGIHVLGAAGTLPKLNAKVESNSSNSFSGSQTQRLAFSEFANVGSELIELSGAITDTWWRVAWTISGTSPQFNFVIIIAIL